MDARGHEDQNRNQKDSLKQIRKNIEQVVLLLVLILPLTGLSKTAGPVVRKQQNQTAEIYKVNFDAPYYPGRMIVRAGVSGASGTGKSAGSLQQVLAKAGAVDIRPLIKSASRSTSFFDGYYQVTLEPGFDAADAAEAVMKKSGILWAEPVYKRRPVFIPNDTFYTNQWYLPQIGMEAAWDVFRQAHPDGGEPVLIGIVDTGVSLFHPDLRDHIYENPDEIAFNSLDDDGNGFVDDTNGWDFGDDDNDPNPTGSTSEGWHGTGVAGVAAGVTNNNTGIASPLFNARILPVKASEDTDVEQFIQNGYVGIVYAVDQGADIINLSFGGAGASNTELAIIQYAVEHDVMVIASAGNDDMNTAFYPASYPGVLSVAATDRDDLKTPFSNWGVGVDLSAPGQSIYTSWNEDDYSSVSGTSFSAPLTAGVAGLVKQHHPTWNARQICEQVRVTADLIDDKNPDYPNHLGFGRLNALRALTVSSPAIRLSDMRLTEMSGSNPNGIAEPGETLFLFIQLTNFLEKTPGGEIRFELADQHAPVLLEDTVVRIPPMNTGESWWNDSEPVTLTVEADAEKGRVFYILAEITDYNGYRDQDWLKVQVAPPIVTLEPQNARLTVSSSGLLGFIDYPENFVGDGFVFGDAGNLLFEGAFMAGTSAENLSDVARGADQSFQNDDFQPVDDGEVILYRPGFFGDVETQAIFTDEHAVNPVYLHVTHRAIAFEDAAAADFVLMAFELRSRSTSPIPNLYTGFFMDWDVGSAGNNLAGFDGRLNLGYVYDPVSEAHGGLQVVSRGGARSYALINNPDDIYDGYTKTEKWHHLSGGIVNRTSRSGSDVSHVLAVGPMTLYPDSVIRVGFAILGGENLADLQINAAEAEARWRGIFNDEPDLYPVHSFSVSGNYPNPFNAGTIIQYELPEWREVTLNIYDLKGREVIRLIDGGRDRGVHQVIWDGRTATGPAASGIYTYRFRAGSDIRSGKMVLIR